METLSAAKTIPIHQKPSNYDEIAMQQSLLFTDSLKDLKNLRTQLYSAAEYFELSCMDEEQQHMVFETLKDYAIKALVNTVDHLGSVSYKVSDILDEKSGEVSETELRLSCIEQRLRTCRVYSNWEGMAHQSSVINTPSYHRRYTLAAGKTLKAANCEYQRVQACNLEDVDDWYRLRTAVRATIRETPPSTSFRKGRSVSPSMRHSRPPVGTFSFSANTTPSKEFAKRSISPHRFTLLRSGSFAMRTVVPQPTSRPTTPPNSSVDWKRFSSAPHKSSSMRVYDVMREIDNSDENTNCNKYNNEEKEVQRAPSKSKRLLKALLSRRKSKKDETLDTYLDEY